MTDIQQHPLDVAMNNLAKNPASTWWPRGMEDLKREWRAGFVDPVRDPEGRFQALLAKPQEALDRTVSHWDKRRGEFVVHTPDKTFNAVMNFARCITEYNLQGAGYYLSAIYPKYMHISTGWYGRESGGDHASNEMNLRMYATLQFPDDKGDPPAGSLAAAADGPRPPRKGGYIGWGNWDFAPFREENNTAYWVVQVWQNYRWTARKEFLKDMWPHIVRAVDWELSNEDPDGDGLFRSDYEYWNCDSGGKGPKGAGPTAICYGMLDSAARIAHEIGEQESEKHYRKLADKTRLEANRQLWSEKYGVLGTRGSDDILRTHPQVWDEYFAVLFGLFDESQGRRAMRWLESHYGFTGDRPDVRLLSCSDWWPHRWSNHWVPVGDTLLAATAGLRGGDADRWWPYVQTVARSAFRNGFPGIGFSVANSGASGGDMEDVDALDPHPHFVVRGLFGIESDLHEDTLHICPSFPSDWTEASLKTPDVQYEYRREGQVATFRIHTPRPTVKHVRANPGAPEVVTPAEKDSVVKATLGAPIADREPPAHPSTVLSYRQPVQAAQPLTQAQRNRLIRVDLSGSYNISPEDLAGKLKFYFDHKLDEKIPSTIAGWWHTPTIEWPPMPRTLDLPDGTTYLIAGRDSHGLPEKGLLAVASWQPYPLPGGAMIPIGRMCERIYLLLQNYTHPSRCYIPNGEVVLTYADGQRKTVPLIPPFNLDCYYQPFSREGSGVKLGNLVYGQWSAVRPKVPDATANSLMIPTDPKKELKTVELRATCPETILGLAGLTILSAE